MAQQDVAERLGFVAEKLAPMESVVSTATHFVLRKYKDKGLVLRRGSTDLREECL